MRNWLCKLRYIYKNIQKAVFVDRLKGSNIIKDCAYFWKKMEELQLYMIEFDKNSTMKLKAYPLDYAVDGENKQLIIIITYDECTFSANDDVKKAWT